MTARNVYSSEYKTRLYYQWWNSGKPSANRFILDIKPDEECQAIPNLMTVQEWIRNWRSECQELDNKIKQEFENHLVSEKVRMYEAHAKEAGDLRLLAFQWLRENKDSLTAAVAVRLWETCISIEHTVSGVPEALEKMMKMSDNELIEATKTALLESSLESLEINE